MKQKISTGIIGLGMLALVSGTAQAEIGPGASQIASPSAFAGASFGSPIAFGSDWGDVGVGVFGQTLHKDSASRGDADAGIVFGLGNADKYVGLETAVNIATLTHLNGERFGDNGSLGFKLHTNLPGNSAFAVGVVATGRWGNAKNQNTASTYAVGTKVFSISNHALVANLGIGDEGFQEPGHTGANVFGSLAYYVTRQISVIVDDSGRFVNAGISLAPIRSIPATVTIGATNLGNRHGLHTQFAAAIGYGFHF
ncbi:MAG: hypothetical protein ACRETW_05210 [Stenotrophobium sp.]